MLLGIALVLATHAIVISALGVVVAPLADGWHLPRPWHLLAGVLVALALGATAFRAGGRVVDEDRSRCRS